jgi:uncharacterized phage protein (TIGR02218 family)
MTYIATDRLGGKPIDIFIITNGSKFWRYTSSSRDKTVAGSVYKSTPIKRSNLKTPKGISKDKFEIQISNKESFIKDFIKDAPRKSHKIIYQSYHENDPNLEVVTLWQGEISEIKSSMLTSTISCSAVSGQIKKRAAARHFQTSCPYVLYDISTCKADSTSKRKVGTVTAISGKDLTIAEISEANGYFSGGYVDFSFGSDTQTRFIVSQTGSVLTLDVAFNDIEVSSSIIAFPGCDHKLSTCNSKFNNAINYGGQAHYANKNPMGGISVF